MEVAKEKSIKEMAMEELKLEKAMEAKEALKDLYAQLSDAEKVVRNIEREIEDFLDELES